MTRELRYQCRCCDNLTLAAESEYFAAPRRCARCIYTRGVCSDPIHARRDTAPICPACGWTSDFYQEHDPTLHGRPNGVSLREAQENYRRHGAIRSDLLAAV